MREHLGFAQLDHRRDALQRMAAPEQLFEDGRRHVGLRAPVEHQQTSPDREEMLVGLGEVVVHERRFERRVPVGHGLGYRGVSGRRVQQLSNRRHQEARRERLGQVRRRAGLQHRFAARLITARRQDHHRKSAVLAVRAQESQHVQPVHVGHVQVEHDHPHRMSGERLDGLQSRAGLDEADIGQAPSAARTIFRIVGESSTTRIVRISTSQSDGLDTVRAAGVTRRGPV